MTEILNLSGTTPGERPHYDVVIAGGGMAGSMLALALTQRCPELKLAIVEQQADSAPKASFDSRSIALSAGSVQLLQQFGIWERLAPFGCPIMDIAVSDRGHFGKTWLSAAEYRVPALGQVIEVEHIGAVLAAQLAASSQLTRLQPKHISAITPSDKAQQIRLNDGSELQASLLVIAEGGQSATRQLVAVPQHETPYEQTAIIANLALAQRHQNKAFERFTEHGPIALLPLTANRYSLVWTVPPAEADALLALSEPEFLARVQQAFGYRAGVFSGCGKRVAYPLVLRQSPQVVSHRAALLGNSLHSLHPIAGQGFNLALRDIDSLSMLLAQGGSDVGSYAQLRQYEQARQADMQRVIWLTDALVRTFSNRSRLVALARNLGLFAMLMCDDLKTPLARQTMGFGAQYAKS
ncbi:2-octaprenyl-6-methoxyphenyl hydroxylase [Alishewanella longhuensis]|uniref:2-octaprenyl-6-methoxyphenyl hydroxylase n=1 Tax=Alishewanella longhuensis TaxID=1091037 RepID=A0ABQ3KZK9_9ALTE|nr:2-octaprenyl-6-methoxyphenyl hydroxylase [Alishewanella longhuensis]GHG63530.1 2-octaprenyl-6-methoxyphenyl hydroxylase [Alishewanella longhuensis]